MNYKQYNDYELIYMVRENDDYSRDLLYEKYTPIIRKIVSDYFNNFSCYGYDYDDFLQEAFISFQKALRYYDERKNCLFYSFAVMCIKRGLVSFCQRISCKQKNNSLYNTVDLDDYSIEDERVNLDCGIIFKEFECQIKKLLYELPFEIGNILELRINEFTYLEISLLLDIPLSTVNFRCKKIKKCMKSLFSNYYGEKAN